MQASTLREGFESFDLQLTGWGQNWMTCESLSITPSTLQALDWKSMNIYNNNYYYALTTWAISLHQALGIQFLLSLYGHDHWEAMHNLSACMLSRFSHVCLCATLWSVARQAPLSLRFFRQEYWSGLPCPPPGDLPDPGVKPMSFMSSSTGKWALSH